MQEPSGDAFWGYEDLALFIGAIFPSLAGALLIVRPFHISNQGVQALVYQCGFYALLLGSLYLVISLRYRRPFWRSLGWTFEYRGAWLYVAVGIVLAFGLSAIAAALRTPGGSEVQDLMTDRSSMIAVMLFGALIGPVVEEVVFRGFLLPLFAKSMPAGAAIVITAIPFALLHGPTVKWAWQSILVIGLAGVMLGVVRVRSGSTAASALVHVVYNSTLFSGYLLLRSASMKFGGDS